MMTDKTEDDITILEKAEHLELVDVLRQMPWEITHKIAERLRARKWFMPIGTPAPSQPPAPPSSPAPHPPCCTAKR